MSSHKTTHSPSTSNSARHTEIQPLVEISSDEDDQSMCDLPGGVEQTDDDDTIELSSDESLDAYPKSKPKCNKSSVIDSLFKIPKSKVHEVWISSKTLPAEKDQGCFKTPHQENVSERRTIPSFAAAPAAAPQHKLTIGGVEVQFPVKPYSCQIALMFKIITGITKKQNCLLESPTGSGKTLALLCGALAWQQKEKARVADIVARDYYNPFDDGGALTPPKPTHTATPATTPAQPFARTLFGERSIYDGENNDGGGGGGESSGSGFKRQEPLSEDDAAAARSPPRLVKLHKRQKLSGEPTPTPTPTPTSPARTPESGTTPTKGGATQQDSPKELSVPKIYYGARTHKQIAQVVKEFRRTAYVGRARMSILSSREYSCVRELDRSVHANKNDMCRECIATKSKKRGAGEEETACGYYNNRGALCTALPPAWDLEDIVLRGREIGSCPFFAARALAEEADIVFCPYNYLIDPAIRDSELESQGKYLGSNVADAVDVLLRALKNWDHWFQNQTPLLKDVPLSFGESVHTWQAPYFIATLDSHNLGANHLRAFSGSARLLNNIMRDNSDKLYGVSSATIGLCGALATSLGYLYRNEGANLEDFKPTLVRTVTQADDSQPDAGGWRSTQYRKKVSVESLSLRLLCMNPSIVFSGLAPAGCIVLSSGTLTPIVSLHSELGSHFPLVLSTAHVIPPERVWVGTLLTSSEGEDLECTSRGTDRPRTQDGIGRALLWVCRITPNGVLCFVPSYMLMNKLVKRWQETDIWDKLNQTKHVFMESRNVRDHTEIMDEFYAVVGSARGALLLAVYRGKVSEGMDFKDEQARAVVTVGIPFPNTFECMVSNKMKYNDTQSRRQLLPGREWLRVQAFRALNQAVGRCVRHRGDWGAVLLIDSRFHQPYYTEHLSKWVRNFLGDNHHTWKSLVGNPDSLESFMQSMTIRQNEEHD